MAHKNKRSLPKELQDKVGVEKPLVTPKKVKPQQEEEKKQQNSILDIAGNQQSNELNLIIN